MKLNSTELALLAYHLNDIKNKEEQDILSNIMRDLDVETVEDFLEIEQEFIGVAQWDTRHCVYADEEEAIEDGVDEYDICDVYKHTRNGLENEGADSYEADTFNLMLSTLKCAVEKQPEIKTWNINELNEEKIDNLISKIGKLDVNKYLSKNLKTNKKLKISAKI